MDDDEVKRSPELDRVRKLLFPGLSAEEGWKRIDEAFRGAHDPERVDAIERLAEADLNDELIAALRRARP